MKKTVKHLCTTLMVAALLGGCSNTLALPWEDNLLDPESIATQEPLEIPPDLDILPPVQGKTKDRDKTIKQTTSEPESIKWLSPDSTSEANRPIRVPFNIPKDLDDAPLPRTKTEQLPRWMGKDVPNQ